MNSIERALIAVARGWSAGPSPCSITRHGAPRQPRSAASASPTGPPPTINAGVSIVWELSGGILQFTHSAVFSCASPLQISAGQATRLAEALRLQAPASAPFVPAKAGTQGNKQK